MKKFMSAILMSVSLVGCGLESGEGTGTDGVGLNDHRIFITSSTYNGNFGGITEADKKCQEVATSAGLSRTYVAILSDSTTDISSKLSLTGSIYKVDASGQSTKVAETGTDLWATAGSTNQDLLSAVDLTELGAVSTANPWTGTNSEGRVLTNTHCSDWSSSSGNGAVGLSSSQTETWLEYDLNYLCGNTYPLYCISQ